MTIKEYWAVWKQKKGVLDELDKEYERKKAENERQVLKYGLERDFEIRKQILEAKELNLKTREENFEVISRLEHKVKWLEDTLNLERVHSQTLTSILNGNFQKMKDRSEELLDA